MLISYQNIRESQLLDWLLGTGWKATGKSFWGTPVYARRLPSGKRVAVRIPLANEFNAMNLGDLLETLSRLLGKSEQDLLSEIQYSGWDKLTFRILSRDPGPLGWGYFRKWMQGIQQLFCSSIREVIEHRDRYKKLDGRYIRELFRVAKITQTDSCAITVLLPRAEGVLREASIYLLNTLRGLQSGKLEEFPCQNFLKAVQSLDLSRERGLEVRASWSGKRPAQAVTRVVLRTEVFQKTFP